jgi:hypothetical protein
MSSQRGFLRILHSIGAVLAGIVVGVASAFITAWLAPDRPIGHALAGGVAGLIATTVGAVVTWNRGQQFGPHWYPVALIVLALPTAWAGGKLRQVCTAK